MRFLRRARKIRHEGAARQDPNARYNQNDYFDAEVAIGAGTPCLCTGRSSNSELGASFHNNEASSPQIALDFDLSGLVPAAAKASKYEIFNYFMSDEASNPVMKLRKEQSKVRKRVIELRARRG